LDLVREKHQQSVIVVDEASLLQLEVFVELHTITQFDFDSKPWLPIILIGQNHLVDRLKFRKSAPLASRVVDGGSDMLSEMEKTAADLKSKGKKPYIIPGGASNPIGALGYVNCAVETMNQLNVMRLSVEHIVVPSGSAGTHAGMVVGMAGINGGIPISGIDVARPKDIQEELVYKLAAKTVENINVKGGIDRKDVICFDEYVGPVYSLTTDSMTETVKLFAS
jgi:D-cysteine desulfhydrase